MTSWRLKLIQEVSKSDFVTDFLLALLEKSCLEEKKSVVQPSLVALEVVECKL